MSRWRNAVRAELLRYRVNNDQSVVTRQGLLHQSLGVLREQFPEASTPEQTLSRTLQELRDSGEIEFLDNGEYRIQQLAPPFTAGESYTRKSLHDTYGGKRQAGIAPSADYPFVFLFYGETGEAYGYEDGFRGDTFVYTGEGQTGDMEMSHGNRVIRDHADTDRRLYLFENADDGQVTFVGEYQYADHFRQELPDRTGERRSGLRFELIPAESSATEITDTPTFDTEHLDTLYEQAIGGQPSESETREGMSTSYTRSEAVRTFCRAYADGNCEGCDKAAPFIDADGDPYLEVHHLYRRADGGADSPANVVALCPNCHRRRHYGRDGDSFNETLIEYAESRPF